MNKYMSIFIGLSIFFGGIISCKKDKDPVPDLGYNYFPNKVGTYVIYDVDSIYYDDFNNKKDTFKFQLKHKIESIFTDNQGRPTQRIERSVKKYNATIPYSAMNWILKDVWSANVSSTSAEQVEENVRFVKLAFPVKETQKWNGNAQNTLPVWNYSYTFFDLTRTYANRVFDSVLEVNQYDDKNIVLTQRQLYVERYARNIGLIYKRVIEVQSQPDPLFTPFQLQAFFGKPILQRVTSGFQYTYTINSYGTE